MNFPNNVNSNSTAPENRLDRIYTDPEDRDLIDPSKLGVIGQIPPKSNFFDTQREILNQAVARNKQKEAESSSYIQQVASPSLRSSNTFEQRAIEEEAIFNNALQLSANVDDKVLTDERKTELLQKVIFEGNVNDTVLTVALLSDEGGYVNVNDAASTISNYNEATFRSVSSWGKLLDPLAPSPQVNELLSTNAQTLRYMALRIRGGEKGQLWENATPYLKDMFAQSEDKVFKDYLDYATGLNPYFYDVRAGLDIHFVGKTIFDVLAGAPVPEDWDPKQAVEELKKDEKLAFALFVQLGITEEQLLNPDISKNPQTFKYFIADALDTFAMGVMTQQFQATTNSFGNFAFTLAWPLLRDSFNSNDTLADVGLTLAGTAVAAGSALAAPFTGGASLAGTAAGGAAAVKGVAGIAAKLTRAATRLRGAARMVEMHRTANILSRARSGLKTLSQTKYVEQRMLASTARLVSNIYRFAPHNASESILKSLGKLDPKIQKLLYGGEQALTWGEFRKTATLGLAAKTFGRYALRSSLNGAMQGGLEDAFRQYYTLAAGFDNQFNFQKLGENMLEEGAGEFILGGVLNFTSNARHVLNASTNNRFEVLDRASESISKALEPIGKGAAQLATAAWDKLPASARERLETALAIQFGYNNEKLASMKPAERVEFLASAVRLNYLIQEFTTSTGVNNFLLDDDDDSIFSRLLLGLADGAEGGVSVEMRQGLFRFLSAAHERSRNNATGAPGLQAKHFKSLAYAWARDRVLQSNADSETQQRILNRLDVAWSADIVESMGLAFNDVLPATWDKTQNLTLSGLENLTKEQREPILQRIADLRLNLEKETLQILGLEDASGASQTVNLGVDSESADTIMEAARLLADSLGTDIKISGVNLNSILARQSQKPAPQTAPQAPQAPQPPEPAPQAPQPPEPAPQAPQAPQAPEPAPQAPEAAPEAAPVSPEAAPVTQTNEDIETAAVSDLTQDQLDEISKQSTLSDQSASELQALLRNLGCN